MRSPVASYVNILSGPTDSVIELLAPARVTAPTRVLEYARGDAEGMLVVAASGVASVESESIDERARAAPAAGAPATATAASAHEPAVGEVSETLTRPAPAAAWR